MSTLRYLVAFSGGLDSTVLLFLLKQALACDSQAELHAIHIHHGLQTEADDWGRHCQDICQRWQIPLSLIHVQAKAAVGESPEATARAVRYQAIMQHMTPHTVLVTGHHQDDQVETLLLQLLRGASAKGLSAMPTWKELVTGWHYRPLLTHSRQQLQTIAHSHQLTWIQDPSNECRQFARNRLRHDILPRLAEHWPGYRKTLSRSADLLAQHQNLLQQFAQEQLAQLGATAHDFPLNAFSLLSLDRQALLLRTWLAQQALTMPNAAKLRQFLQDLQRAGPERHPQLRWAHWQLYRHRHSLHWQVVINAKGTHPWPHFPATLQHGTGLLSATPSLGGLRTLSLAEISQLNIRYWQQGGRFQPHGRQHSQSLKKLWQEWGVAMECRRQIPLLYCQDTLIAVGELAIAKDWYSATDAWQLRLIKDNRSL